MQQKNELLRAPDRKCWHDNLSTPPCRVAHYVSQFSGDVPDVLMKAVAVSAFHDQIIDRGQGLGVMDNWQTFSSDISRKSKPNSVSLKNHGSRTEHVPGVECLI